MDFATKQRYKGLRKMAEFHFEKSRSANPLKSLHHIRMARSYLSRANELLESSSAITK